MKNLLFITWDSPQTSYMEGLFMPIFHEIAKKENIQFHVIQFTWADKKKTDEVKKIAVNFGIKYTNFPIFRKSLPSIGSFITLFAAGRKIKKYIKDNKIDVVMPRSTFPAIMVNNIKNRTFKTIFDADGLPIEERVDFSGLKKGSTLYKFLKSGESKMLRHADAVITRSQKSIEIHLENIGEKYRNKFSVVYNGRDQLQFCLSSEYRDRARERLALMNEFLFVYAGSLGSQYCLKEMLAVFNNYSKDHSSKFLILTGNIEFALQNIPAELKDRIIIKKVNADEVSFYLNAADFAFALRKPSFSMQGVAPIKLGEYLLCGLPVIASKGIGDTERILQNFPECYLFDHSLDLKKQLPEINAFIKHSVLVDKEKIRKKALQYFSLESAAESYMKAFEKLGT